MTPVGALIGFLTLLLVLAIIVVLARSGLTKNFSRYLTAGELEALRRSSGCLTTTKAQRQAIDSVVVYVVPWW